jgi:hypothetical protein
MDDPDVVGWLSLRNIAPELVAARDLARALPKEGPLPSWMRFEGRSWRESSHRLIVPLRGPDGRIESLHARALAPREANGRDKAASPARAEIRGLVMAEMRALFMLDGDTAPESLLIVEGVPDFLTWATRYPDNDVVAPAVIGVISGSWSDAVAQRVPAGLRVAVRVHRDDAGRRYAARIRTSLEARCAVHFFSEES